MTIYKFEVIKKVRFLCFNGFKKTAERLLWVQHCIAGRVFKEISFTILNLGESLFGSFQQIIVSNYFYTC